jgi:hypothetical protein
MRHGSAERLGTELCDCHWVLMKFGQDSAREFTALAKERGRFGGELAPLRQQARQRSAVVELFFQQTDTTPAAVASPVSAADPATAASTEAAPEPDPATAAPKPDLGPGIELF